MAIGDPIDVDTADARALALALNRLHSCVESVAAQVKAQRYESRNRHNETKGRLDQVGLRVGRVEATVSALATTVAHVEGVQQGVAQGLGIAVRRPGADAEGNGDTTARPTLVLMNRSKALWAIVAAAGGGAVGYKVLWAGLSAAAIAVHHAMLAAAVAPH